MEIKIVEKIENDDGYGRMQPLSYRVSIGYYRNVFTITREYFRVGFCDGEKWDDFFFVGHPIRKISFMTRKLDNTEYLRDTENKLIKLFYKKTLESKNKLNKELIKTTNEINSKIKMCDKISNYLDKYNRKDKIKNISDIING